MSKKKKKKPSPKGVKSNIKPIACVDCPRDINLIVKQTDCAKCEFNEKGYCNFVVPKQLIEIISHGTPLKFNRSFFQSASDDVASSTRNYYLFTDIMHDVRSISGHPNYSRIKAKFLAGGFKGETEDEALRVVDALTPALSLAQSEDGDPDIIVDGKKYIIKESNGKVEGSWEVLYYLYDMLDLDGFADIKVNSRWYKVRLSPIQQSKESYVLARQGNELVIGRIEK